jgi:hypothetical protein
MGKEESQEKLSLSEDPSKPSPAKGEVVYLYAFDVADEIQMEKINRILAKKPVPFEIQVDRTLPKDIPFYRPLSIDPKRESWKMGGVPVQTALRIYEVGVVSIMISIPFEVKSLSDLLPFHQPRLDHHHPLDKAAHALCVDVVHSLKDYLVRPIPKVGTPEAYTVFCLRDLHGAKNIQSWGQEHQREIAGILSETRPDLLSSQQVEETFRHFLSFDRDDLAVIDWDAALLVNLSGKLDDEIHVLELANLQLEELVLMDKRLDDYLGHAYKKLESKRRLFLMRRKELIRLRRFLVDVAKITDEVSNISKFFGDWYLARLYLAARERFHINTWRESIQNRLTNLDNLYEVLRTESNETRMLVLEVLIVLLFIVDLVALFSRK